MGSGNTLLQAGCQIQDYLEKQKKTLGQFSQDQHVKFTYEIKFLKFYFQSIS
jgi:hypothetical protein